MMKETTFNTLKKHRGIAELLADFDTPLSLYLKLANAPLNYLLESAVHEKQFGRYSFIGLPMIAISPSEVELLRYNEKVSLHSTTSW